MPLYRRGSTWWVNITHRGRRVRQTTGTQDKARAQQIHDQLKADLWQQVDAGHTLADALKLWLEAEPRSRNDRNNLALFRDLYRNRPLADITGPDIAQALAGKGPAHYNRIVAVVRAALNMAAAHGMIARPPRIPRRKPPAGRIRWLTPAEWDTLRPHLPAHIRPMADFALATGLRQANVLQLRWNQIDMARRVCWVQGADAKARKPIGVPLNDSALAALREVLGQHQEFVFTYRVKKGRDGAPEVRRPIASPKTAWNTAIEAAKIAPATWHDLRHTWASWHVMNGTPLAVLRELGGWASMDMVMRYAHLAPDHVQAWAANGRPPVDQSKETLNGR
jgi:integrase